MEQSKEEFLEQFGGDYGYPEAPRGIDELRAADFKRLEGVIPRSSRFVGENSKLNLLVSCNVCCRAHTLLYWEF